LVGGESLKRGVSTDGPDAPEALSRPVPHLIWRPGVFVIFLVTSLCICNAQGGPASCTVVRRIRNDHGDFRNRKMNLE
jgi:hypothetical protein